ncbi:hypothetical protein EVAR_54497_1 [Eumeta japonica]|uniref:Uncharacterized protein n=1 Tax=Eumeta variegata TaxID=151549 RepID=A0A4C1YK89_EUMVA|nr:hypothetical protein EVAR_54497_1 [Eumeta japonica]
MKLKNRNEREKVYAARACDRDSNRKREQGSSGNPGVHSQPHVLDTLWLNSVAIERFVPRVRCPGIDSGTADGRCRRCGHNVRGRRLNILPEAWSQRFDFTKSNTLLFGSDQDPNRHFFAPRRCSLPHGRHRSMVSICRVCYNHNEHHRVRSQCI